MSARGAIAKAAATVQAIQTPPPPDCAPEAMAWAFWVGIGAIWIAVIAVAVLILKTRRMSRETEEMWRETKEQFSELRTLSQVRPLK